VKRRTKAVLALAVAFFADYGLEVLAAPFTWDDFAKGQKFKMLLWAGSPLALGIDPLRGIDPLDK
jgi:aromatic ring-cleaving dioxygenase